MTGDTPPSDDGLVDHLGNPVHPPTVPEDPLAIARVRGFYVVLALIVGLAVYGAVSPSAVDISVFGFLAGILLALGGLGTVVKVISFTGRK